MCTVSWIHTNAGYHLLCNRDEQSTRLLATMPQLLECDGVRYIAPRDGNFGGTWIIANECGLTLALLNRSGFGVKATRSRGHLVRELAGSSSLEDLRDSMTGRRLAPFAGFRLVALQPGRPASLFEWDGRWLKVTDHAEQQMPLTSSSFDPEGVETKRRLEFSTRLRSAGELSVDVLFDFHRSHGIRADNPSAYTTCMHRPGAQTVSFTWVEVSDSDVRLFYSPAAPCQWAPGETLALPRHANTLSPCG